MAPTGGLKPLPEKTWWKRIRRRLPFRYWWHERRLRRELDELKRTYLPRIAQAKKVSEIDHQNMLGEYYQEQDFLLFDLRQIQESRLSTQARRWLISFPTEPDEPPDDDPDPPTETGPWVRGPLNMWCLKPEAELEIRRAVRKEWRESVTFWVSIIFGGLGLLIGLVSVWRR